MKKIIVFLAALMLLTGCSAVKSAKTQASKEQTTLSETKITEKKTVDTSSSVKTTSKDEEITISTEVTTITTEQTTTVQENILGDIIRPEIKEAIDSYEAFVDEYVKFMKKYNNSGDSLSMLGDYLDYTEKSLKMSKEFEEIADKELTDAEALYYSDVLLRCSQKMLEAAY